MMLLLADERKEMDTTIHPALEGFLSYAGPGNYYPAPYFYPEMGTRGGDMMIKEKARVAWERELEVEILSKPTGEPRKGCIVSIDTKRNSISVRGAPGGCTHFWFSDIIDIRFVEPLEDDQFHGAECKEEPQELTAYDIDALIAENAELKRRNAELERSLGEPEQVEHDTKIYDSIVRAFENREEVRIGYREDGKYYERTGWIEQIDTDLHGGVITHTIRLQRKAGVGFTCSLSSIEQVTTLAQPHDIASERWLVVCGADGVFTLYADTEPVATIAMEGMSKEQIYLMTAAPELADRARDVCSIGIPGEAHALSDAVCELAKLLRKLGLLHSQNRDDVSRETLDEGGLKIGETGGY